MVMRALQIVLLACLAFPTFAVADSPSGPPANYRLGETLAQDVITPVPLTVVDADATAALRQQETSRIPIIYRFNPRAATEAETAFQKTLAAAREKFFDAIERQFDTRKLNDQTAGLNDFLAAFQNSQAQRKDFSPPPRLLVAWAKGESADVLEATLTGRLRDAMSRYIRPEELPASMKSSPLARVAAAPADETLTLDAVERQHDDIARTNMATLAQARADLVAAFPADEEPAARYLAGFVRENCLPDMNLTEQFLARNTESVVSAQNYAPGQLLIRRGQLITPKIKTVLDQLTDAIRVSQLQEQVAASRLQSLLSGERTRWLLVALAVVLAIFSFVIWRLTAFRKSVPAVVPAASSNLPLRIVGAETDGMVISCPTCQEHIAVPFAEAHQCHPEHATPDEWKKRALAAERRAEQAAAMVRAGLLDQIARQITGDMVQQLINQRDQLAYTQEQAAAEMELLENRLARTHGDWQSWRQVYEQRIAELEKELADSNELNRALIKNKIAVARQQMASAEAASKTENWN